MDTTEKNKARATAERVIAALGGTAEVARIAEVEMSAVSQWRQNGIPKPRMMFFEAKFPELDWCALKGITSKKLSTDKYNRRKSERRSPKDRRKGTCTE